MAVKGQRSHTNFPHADGKTGQGEIDVADLRNEHVHHEEGDVNPRPVYKFLIWLGVATVFVYLLIYGIMKWNDNRAAKMNAEVTHVAKPKSQQLPPEPRLQLAPGHASHPLEEGLAYRDSTQRVLHTYAYLNKQAGVVRMPIDVAKDALLKHGLPASPNSTLTSAGIDVVPAMSNGGRTYMARDQRIPTSTATSVESSTSAHKE